MGGPGSGNWYRWDRRTTLDDVKRLDIRWLSQQGSLRPGVYRSISWTRGERPTGDIVIQCQQESLVLIYRYRARGGDWEPVRQTVPLVWTPCHYGGQRPWFCCPGCRQRVAVLCGYGKWFLCRHCYRLPYGSQSETPQDRRYRKVRKIRKRLGVSGNLMDPLWPWKKPKGMHWRTWEQLCRQEKVVHTAVDYDMYERLVRLLGHDGSRFLEEG
jgi:hypothetical protein